MTSLLALLTERTCERIGHDRRATTSGVSILGVCDATSLAGRRRVTHVLLELRDRDRTTLQDEGGARRAEGGLGHIFYLHVLITTQTELALDGTEAG